MRKIKEFFVNSLIGGLVVVLPVWLPLEILFWLFTLISNVVTPITNLVVAYAGIPKAAANTAALVAIVLGFFCIGTFVRTRVGSLIHEFFEQEFLRKIIPFYSIFRKTLLQIAKRKKPIFVSAALFFPWGLNNTGKIGFISEYPNEEYSVCIEPSAIDPTKGTLHVLRNDAVFPLGDLLMNDIMGAAIGCGVGLRFPPRSELASLAELVACGNRPQ